MKSLRLFISIFLMLFLLCGTVTAAKELTVDRINDMAGIKDSAFFDDDETFTEQFEGVITEANNDYLVITKGEKQIRLLVDAESVIYIDEQKASFSNIKNGDYVFGFYVVENGTYKCDYIDIIR